MSSPIRGFSCKKLVSGKVSFTRISSKCGKCGLCNCNRMLSIQARFNGSSVAKMGGICAPRAIAFTILNSCMQGREYTCAMDEIIALAEEACEDRRGTNVELLSSLMSIHKNGCKKK